MPLWHVHHPVGAYSARQKREFAADVTEFYTRFGLPKFYVVTLFHEVEESSFLVGGEPSGATVRIVVEHIARHVEDPDVRTRMSEALGRLVAPHTQERGFHCEFHVNETPRDLWMIDGMAPPPSRSEAERLWVRENRPVAY
ncbi:tautomerase family protein [Streptomyces sp. AV19]|uniref:tautomerase family protein n=1 Tax=Streptomyces sp. AV19 TaxID=2793068 RepID=UPI0018FE07C3|nr:tautomerase family protein [Streptomyces sp. AV19]MBH1938717.1 tautomerase family protein [Streptomyces sp. AV19]MDG4533978.1 tautomerase family protein [Streptomyces sp. AV19]